MKLPHEFIKKQIESSNIFVDAHARSILKKEKWSFLNRAFLDLENQTSQTVDFVANKEFIDYENKIRIKFFICANTVYNSNDNPWIVLLDGDKHFKGGGFARLNLKSNKVYNISGFWLDDFFPSHYIKDEQGNSLGAGVSCKNINGELVGSHLLEDVYKACTVHLDYEEKQQNHYYKGEYYTISIFFPLIILSGSLYETYIDKGGNIKTNSTHFIPCKFNQFSANYPEKWITPHIVTLSGFNEYINDIKASTKSIKEAVLEAIEVSQENLSTVPPEQILGDSIDSFLPDKAILNSIDDSFNREAFAKIIAKSINNMSIPNSFTIGLHGRWGEGKSSTLNLMYKNLSSKNIVIHFNPWEYNGEQAIIEGFFNELIYYTQPKLNRNSIDSEKLKNLVDGYQEWAKSSSSKFTIEQTSRRNLSNELYHLNRQLDNFLEVSKTKLVFIIDDIDRLNSAEIYTIFKLVKQILNLKYITYVLAFDKEVVAKSIGNRYDKNKKEDGILFLEKIIQMPLELPKILLKDLNNYFFNTVGSITKEYLITEEKIAFINYIRDFKIINQIKSPREIIRYCNNINFACSALYGEANMVDLLLLEAIKLWYPLLYSFIKINDGNILLKVYNPQIEHLIPSQMQAQKTAAKNTIQDFIKTNYPDYIVEIKMILDHLFPAIDVNNHNQNNYQKWYSNKRIGAAYFFQRYFTYAIPRGDLPEYAFQDLLISLDQKISVSSTQFLQNDIENTINKYKSNFDTFIYKIAGSIKKTPHLVAKNLIRTITKMYTWDYLNHESMFLVDKEKGFQRAYFVLEQVRLLFGRLNTIADKRNTFLDVVELSSSYPFTLGLINSFEEEKNNFTFSDKILKDIKNETVYHFTNSEKIELAFSNYKYRLPHLLRIWKGIEDLHSRSVKEYIDSYLTIDLNTNLIKFIKILLGFNYYPPNYSTPYLSSLEEKDYKNIIDLYPANKLVDLLKQVYGKEIDTEDYPKVEDSRIHKVTDEEYAMQFMYFYNMDNGGKKKEYPKNDDDIDNIE